MTLTNLSVNESIPTGSPSSRRPSQHTVQQDPDGGAISCNSHLRELVKEIEPPKVRAVVDKVFQDLLRLIEYLRPTESQLRHVEAAQKTIATFQYIHDEARALLKYIEEDVLTRQTLEHNLRDALDGIVFTVGHELNRVFESGFGGNMAEATGPVILGQLVRANHLLTNCLQQAVIGLARLFDPEFVETKIFKNADLRYWQSLQLCDELSALLKLIKAQTDAQSALALPNLTADIDRFREETMEFLMYSDWPQFESFCEKIRLAESSADLDSVLHQFRCYLETLLGQVKLRAVLANVFPIEFGADGNQQSASSAEDSSIQSYADTVFQNDGSATDPATIGV